ncbi:MAG: methionine synthase [Bacteroidales bacterium]|jgi:hypothetical protein|nr:methionine synthase [Bacteroidales bacterium]
MMFFEDTSFSEIPFRYDDLYSLMGYIDNKTPDEEVQMLIENMLLELQPVCKPRMGYKVVRGEAISKKEIRLEDKVLNTGKIITYALHESERFAVFTATVGADFDCWLKRTEKEDDIVKAYIANTLGSIIAEATVSLLLQRLEATLTDEKMSNNYSPGYCDWALIEQKKLLSLFPFGVTGISLTESCLMLPIKSVSGIVGIGKNVQKRPYGCAICKMKNCIRNKNRHLKPKKNIE